MRTLLRSVLVPALAMFANVAQLHAADGAGTPHTGDHIAIIGGGLADRMQHDGTLEAMLSKTYPQYDLVFRNLGFAGDEIEERMRSESFGSPDDWLKRTKADVVWAFFGFNESFAGKEGVAAFKGKLHQFVHLTVAANYSGKAPARLVLFTPIAAEKGTDPDWADPAPLNANLVLYSAAIAEVAAEMKLPMDKPSGTRLQVKVVGVPCAPGQRGLRKKLGPFRSAASTSAMTLVGGGNSDE